MNRNLHSKIQLLASFALILGLITANAFAAKKKEPTKVEGIVVKLDGSSLVINAADEKHFTMMTIATDTGTTVVVDGKPAKLADLQPGQRVIVAPPKGTAKEIEEKSPRKVKPSPTGEIEGPIIAVTESQVIVRTPMSSGEIADAQASTIESTKVIIDGKEAKLADLKPGQFASVVMFGGNARRIVVQTALQ